MKKVDQKRHRYDDIIMGFYGKAFDNGLQAKVAGSKFSSKNPIFLG